MPVWTLARTRLFFLAFAVLAIFMSHPAVAADTHAPGVSVNMNTQFVYDVYRGAGFCFPYVSAEDFSIAASTAGFPFVKISGEKQKGDVLLFNKYMAIYAGKDKQGYDLMTIYYNNKKTNMRVKDFSRPVAGVYRYQVCSSPDCEAPCKRFNSAVWEHGKIVNVNPLQDPRFLRWR